MLEQTFQKAKVITGKNFVPYDRYILYSPFYLPQDGLPRGQFYMQYCTFNFSTVNYKTIPVFRKSFSIFRKVVAKLKYWKHSKFLVIVT